MYAEIVLVRTSRLSRSCGKIDTALPEKTAHVLITMINTALAGPTATASLQLREFSATSKEDSVSGPEEGSKASPAPEESNSKEEILTSKDESASKPSNTSISKNAAGEETETKKHEETVVIAAPGESPIVLRGSKEQNTELLKSVGIGSPASRPAAPSLLHGIGSPASFGVRSMRRSNSVPRGFLGAPGSFAPHPGSSAATMNIQAQPLGTRTFLPRPTAEAIGRLSHLRILLAQDEKTASAKDALERELEGVERELQTRELLGTSALGGNNTGSHHGGRAAGSSASRRTGGSAVGGSSSSSETVPSKPLVEGGRLNLQALVAAELPKKSVLNFCENFIYKFESPL